MSRESHVSAIMPVFNGEVFLGEAIESVLAQSHGNVELVVVNDGSTDGSAGILAGYGSRIRVFHEENLGPAVARNRAIAAAQGEWIAFLDQDDVWERNRLERQLAALRPGDDGVHSECRIIDAAGRTIRARFSHGENEEYTTLARTITLNPIYVPTVLVRRRAVLEVNGLDPANRFGTDDYQLSLRLLATGHRYHYLPDVLASYRVHGRNRSANHTSMMRGDIYAIGQTYAEYPQGFRRADLTAFHAKMHELYFTLGWHYQDNGEPAEARRCFRQAAAHRPTCWRTLLCAAAASWPGGGALAAARRLDGPKPTAAQQSGWYG